MKKYIKPFFLYLICIVCLNGCAADKSQPTAKMEFDTPYYKWDDITGETLNIWTKAQEMDRKYIQRAVSRYEELTGNKINIVDIPKDEFEGKITGGLTGPDMPDLLLTYGGTNVEKCDPDNTLYDFTDAPWVDDLSNTSINQTIYNGRVIGLPFWESSISGTLYNKKLFRSLNLEVPQTQSEFLEVCQKLLDNGITPVYLPYKEISMLLYQFPLDSIVKDSSVLEGLNDGSLSYSDIPEMKTIIEWYRTMTDSGYFGTDYEDQDWNGMDPAMKSGGYAMIFCWDTWLYTDYTGDPSDFGLMPAFMGVPESGTFEGPNLALMTVNKNSPRLDAALNFINFLADPYNYNVAFENIYTAPVFQNQKASISTPQYSETERLIEKNFLDSVAWLRIRGFSQMDAVYIQNYMTHKPQYTLEDCLRDMDTARLSRLK